LLPVTSVVNTLDLHFISFLIFFIILFFQANFKIKGWKQRWFVLDSTKHELRYYDTREDFQCKGVVPLHEVNNTQVGNNTTPGAPKKTEDKCFFELQTVKRNYCFCAESKLDAERWVSKIQMCLQ
jgi:myotubularin-related protein 5/13